MAVGPISILVNDQPYGSVISVPGNGIAYAKVTIFAPGQPNTPWKITTTNDLLPFDKVEGVTDANAQAVVYLGPSRLKGDTDFKVTVTSRNKTVAVRFSNP